MCYQSSDSNNSTQFFRAKCSPIAKENLTNWIVNKTSREQQGPEVLAGIAEATTTVE